MFSYVIYKCCGLIIILLQNNKYYKLPIQKIIMTTILGIKTNDGEEGIVLASDTQLNLYEGDTYTKKKGMFKLYTDRQEKSWGIAFSGCFVQISIYFNAALCIT